MTRPRTPTSILKARGAYEVNPARLKDRQDEPRPDTPIGEPSECLTEAQKACWRETVSLVVPGVLTGSDRLWLEDFCRLLAEVRATGTFRKSADRAAYQKCLERMGMNPSDRSRVRAPRKTKDDDEKFFGPSTPVEIRKAN